MAITVVLEQTLGNETVNNVLRYEGADAIPTFGPELADEFRQLFDTFWADNATPFWSFTGITVYDLPNPPSKPGLFFAPTQGTLVGRGVGAGLPTGSALLATFRCLAGPPYNGRSYLAGLDTTNMTGNGQFDNDAVSGAQLMVDQWKNLVGTGLADLRQVIMSTKSKTVPFGTTADVTSAVVNPNPASQSRRRVGRGS